TALGAAGACRARLRRDGTGNRRKCLILLHLQFPIMLIMRLVYVGCWERRMADDATKKPAAAPAAGAGSHSLPRRSGGPGPAFEELVELMARLRTPGSGCPWDLEQTFATIAPYTIEEAYEVADAIERNDMGELRGELGDLLFQSVFHARMAEEAGSFDI